jgi:phosphoesterase RecJ-like protein
VDHHKNNSIEARLKIVDEHASSSCEMLYHLFGDWRMEITPEIATFLFAGACHDTMFFKYNENETDTFRVASELIAKGADKAGILYHVFNNMDLAFVKNVGRMLEWIRIEKTASGKSFARVALNFEEYRAMGAPLNIREYVADSYLQSIRETLFGIVMVEETKGKLSVSFRGKEQSDMSALARLFGGGGHTLRAGATLYGSSFDDLVNQVVSTLQKQA